MRVINIRFCLYALSEGKKRDENRSYPATIKTRLQSQRRVVVGVVISIDRSGVAVRGIR